MTDANGLWESLRQSGRVQGDMPPPEAPLPWFVRLLQGAAGWMAAVFLLGFLGVLMPDLFKHPENAMIVGGLQLLLAAVLLRRPGALFAAQFGLAVSLSGQALLLAACRDYWDTSVFWAGWAGLQALLVWGFPYSVHRFLSSLWAVYALCAALASTVVFWWMPSLLALGAAGLWLTEARWLHRASLGSPVAYALTIALLQLHAFTLVSPLVLAELLQTGSRLQAPSATVLMLAEGLLAGVWVLTAACLMRAQGVKAASRSGAAAWAGIVAVAVLSQAAPGFAVAWMLLLLGFAGANKVLVGVGFFTFLAYLSRYYYLLEMPLVEKSLWLSVAGLAMLAAYGALHRWLRPENDDA